MNSLLKKFKKDKISLIAVIVLILMYLAILFASFLSPYEKTGLTENFLIRRLLKFTQLRLITSFQSHIFTI